MTKEIKQVDELKVSDLEAHPVWQYIDHEDADETCVCPIEEVPTSSLDGKIVGVQVKLANGQSFWALIGNIDAKNARLTENFVTISINNNDAWFTLARYHDFDYLDRGPEALADFLSLSVDEVFPIEYDVRKCARGDDAALAGRILREPLERLSRSEIIAIAVPMAPLK